MHKFSQINKLLSEMKDEILLKCNWLNHDSEIITKLNESKSQNLENMIEALFYWERYLKCIVSWIENETTINELTLWENDESRREYPSPIDWVSEEKIINMWRLFVKSSMSWWEWPVLVCATQVSRPLTEEIIRELEHLNQEFDIYFEDDSLHLSLIELQGGSLVEWFTGYMYPKVDNVNKQIFAVNSLSPNLVKRTNLLDDNKRKNLKTINRYGWERRGTWDLFYTLTYVPTPEDAIIDWYKDYDKYLQEFFESADQNWEAIWEANSYLIEKLDKAESITFRDENWTNLTMCIEWMTFANSLVAKNIPWSEVFSAPIIDSVNWTIVAKGKFQYRSSDWIIEDIVLTFKDWICIGASAKKWQEVLEKFLETPWANKIWELWIWTNPHLRKHLVNWLLVEKVSWSFHVALWSSYKYDVYWWKPVNLNNWNESDVHWDITTMLRWINS